MQTEIIDHHRRRLLGAAAVTIAATQLGLTRHANAQAATGPGANVFSAPLKQVDAGVLNVGYVEAGVPNGPTVILLHGWPYDIHSFVEVVPLLAAAGYRVIVPYLRGYGTTRFLSRTRRCATGSNRPSRVDIVALMDALGIERRSSPGSTGARGPPTSSRRSGRSACKAMVSVSGYLIGSQEANKAPCRPRPSSHGGTSSTSPPSAAGPATRNTGSDFARLIWQIASPKWTFDDATFERSAEAFDNPDHVAIVIHNYRWRLGLAEGERSTTRSRSGSPQAPVISVPTITMEGDANGAPHPEPAAYAKQVLRQVCAPAHHRRHRPQPAAGSAARVRPGCH